jgi:hypothetical protein
MGFGESHADLRARLSSFLMFSIQAELGLETFHNRKAVTGLNPVTALRTLNLVGNVYPRQPILRASASQSALVLNPSDEAPATLPSEAVFSQRHSRLQSL